MRGLLTCPAPGGESFSKEIKDNADNEYRCKEKRHEVSPQVGEERVRQSSSIVETPVDPLKEKQHYTLEDCYTQLPYQTA